ncbi:hypothetical protein ACTHAM_002935 [Cellulomonas soli]|uniref:hypothetical protein n=1 Tax=Cellulomonas soli TaxID=931535 RepID=UPI003F87643E
MVLVRLVLAVLVAAPLVALTLMGVDDWHHVDTRSVPGVSTTTHCRYAEGDPVACFGSFTSDDGTLVLHDVEIRLDRTPDRTGPASAAPSGGSWVAAGTGSGRVVALLVAQALSTAGVWLIAYGVTIAALIWLVLLWTARQVGRAFTSVGSGASVSRVER